MPRFQVKHPSLSTPSALQTPSPQIADSQDIGSLSGVEVEHVRLPRSRDLAACLSKPVDGKNRLFCVDRPPATPGALQEVSCPQGSIVWGSESQDVDSRRIIGYRDGAIAMQAPVTDGTGVPCGQQSQYLPGLRPCPTSFAAYDCASFPQSEGISFESAGSFSEQVASLNDTETPPPACKPVSSSTISSTPALTPTPTPIVTPSSTINIQASPTSWWQAATSAASTLATGVLGAATTYVQAASPSATLQSSPAANPSYGVSNETVALAAAGSLVALAGLIYAGYRFVRYCATHEPRARQMTRITHINNTARADIIVSNPVYTENARRERIASIESATGVPSINLDAINLGSPTPYLVPQIIVNEGAQYETIPERFRQTANSSPSDGVSQHSSATNGTNNNYLDTSAIHGNGTLRRAPVLAASQNDIASYLTVQGEGAAIPGSHSNQTLYLDVRPGAHLEDDRVSFAATVYATIDTPMADTPVPEAVSDSANSTLRASSPVTRPNASYEGITIGLVAARVAQLEGSDEEYVPMERV